MLSLLESLGDFENKLVEHGITTGGFIVDKNYGKIDFNRNYKAFNIYETGYYVELDNKYDIIFEAIVRLSKALGLDNLQFVIEGVKKEELSNTKRYNLRLKYLEKKHIEDIIGISINDTEYITDNLIGALTELCNHLDKDKIKSYKSTGFDKDSNKAYTDNSIRGIKKFIETNFSNIKIEFILHIKSEWEI